jgi:alanine-glyoxylate transaminase/serine-glyoxylate transaminase/serine-pyruvate transaminase
MVVQRGWNFLMTPGPTNIPAQILSSMNRPALEYAGPEFISMSKQVHKDVRALFRTEHEVFIYAANGHGAWEAALSNTLSPGDKVLVPGTGQFSLGWSSMAQSLGIDSIHLDSDWRHGINPKEVETFLQGDNNHEIKAVLMVQTDTATGITSDVAAVRRALDTAEHPALFMVDTVASLITTEYRMDDWGVDVTVAGCQKGIMMPPGISFTAASAKALKINQTASTSRQYWDWRSRRGDVHYKWYCGTGPINMIFGLREAIDMIMEETLEVAVKRHYRLARAVRAAVTQWASAGAIEINALIENQRANGVTTVLVDQNIDVESLVKHCRENYNVAISHGLGRLEGKSFRIGHMGFVNEAMVMGALASLELSFCKLEIPHGSGGVSAAIEDLM